MSRKKIAIVASGLIVAGIAGYAFRPELLFVNEKVNEAFPGGTAQAASSVRPVALSQGAFRGVAHKTDGMAAIYQLPDGKQVLRLTKFETSNGPDVHVYLVAAADAKDSAAVKQAGFLDLGKLKGNQGDQNYDLPADVDLGKYRDVTIWCARFGVNFGTAPLMAAQPSMAMDDQPTSLSSGRFRGIAHDTEGTATIYRLADGKRILRLTDFKTSNGPDVHVYAVAAPDAKDSAAVKQAGFVDLGKLKGNQGDQNYELPADLDLNRYQAVTIWCARFSVNFGTAPLMAPKG